MTIDTYYDISQFTKATKAETPTINSARTKAAPTVSIDTSAVKRLRHLDDLGPGVSDTIKREIESGPLDPAKWNFSESRNEWQFWVTCELVRAGVDDETIYAVLTDRNFSISKTIFEQHDGSARPGPEKYAIRQVTEARKEVGPVKPKVFVPDGKRQNIECAAELGPLLREHGVYRRGRTVMASGPDGHLEPVKGPRAVTMLEQVAVFMAWREEKRGTGKYVPVPTLLPKETAAVLIESDDLIGALPAITVVSRWPLLIEEDGQLVEVTGYHEPTGIYVLPDAPAAEVVPFDDAARALPDLLRNFKFREPADRARAVMAIIKPALNASGMLRSGRVPIDVIEKDKSQAGGGYMAKMIHAVYRCDRPGLIGQTNGGVGSVREAIHTKLIEGHQFIQLDNWKGMLNEPALEIALTENSIDCRMPGVKGVSVDPRQTCFLMTSNGAELTEDLANRANIIRIEKQPLGYDEWYPWPEGGLLEHVEARQPFYLGCVFAVLRRWHDLGKPLADDNGQHDFRAWARAARYIAQSLLGLADPLEEYRKVQREKATPAMTWLRKVTLAVADAGRDAQPLKASDLLGIIIDREDIEVPGMAAADRHSEDDDTKRKALQGIGKRLGSAFAAAVEEDRGDGVKVRRITVDGKPITRHETPRVGGRPEKHYIFGEFDTLPDYSGLGGDEGEKREVPF